MSESNWRISGNFVDLAAQRIFPAEVTIAAGKIAAVRELCEPQSTFLSPGFVDAHIHVESSLLVPAEFARAAVIHGTVATVSDPHEIANVLGVAGVEYMLASASQTPLKFCFGAPSCVPATNWETAGATLGVDQVQALLADERIGYLSEVMNYPGVIQGDAVMLAKIAAAKKCGKPIDGHAPQLRGGDAQAYFAAGISTDHECITESEAREKLALGVKIQIREGSAARNFDALQPLLTEHSDQCMFCSDDLHPDLLVEGHIDRLIRRAVANGHDLMQVLRCACVNPVKHYRLPVGQLRVGDPADFVELNNLSEFRVLKTWINGVLVAECGKSHLQSQATKAVNRFHRVIRSAADYRVPAVSQTVRVIVAEDGKLDTRAELATPLIEDGAAIADPARDMLKLAVVNRYAAAPPALAFIRGFGMKRGAIASSVAHDSHNIVAVGASDTSLAAAINAVMDAGGGLAVVQGNQCEILPLPVAGLMSTEAYETVAAAYIRVDRLAKELGSPLRAPFMTLSFMALLVIPELKLSDRGLFDCRQMEFTSLFV